MSGDCDSDPQMSIVLNDDGIKIIQRLDVILIRYYSHFTNKASLQSPVIHLSRELKTKTFLSLSQ